MIKVFPEFEALASTHMDAVRVHSHIIVISVSFQAEMKLHQNEANLV